MPAAVAVPALIGGGASIAGAAMGAKASKNAAKATTVNTVATASCDQSRLQTTTAAMNIPSRDQDARASRASQWARRGS